MMATLFYLLLAYGLSFGFQNKLPFLYSEAYRESGVPQRFLDQLLHCTYCTGFHTGWMTWLLAWGIEGEPPTMGLSIPFSVLGWSFASAGFCYVLDALVRWVEANTEE